MIIFEPIFPWSYVAIVATIIAGIAILLRGLVDYKKGRSLWKDLGGNKPTRIVVMGFSLLAALLMGTAAMNPVVTDRPANNAFHLHVVVDVSDSVLRADGGWERVRRMAYESIKNAVNQTPSDLKKQSTAGILTFRVNTNDSWKNGKLNGLADAFGKLDSSAFASGDGTDIEKGLKEASSSMDRNGGQGAILLISDGNQTEGDALVAAKRLAGQGVPVHVLPVTSRSPAVAITDADLPRLIHSNTQTYVRGLMLNRLPEDLAAAFTLTKTALYKKEKTEEGTANASVVSQRQIDLPTGKWVRFRWPVIFDSFGIQFIDLELTPRGSNEPHRRRFYTYVKRPPRIIAIGGDNRWISAIPGDVAEVVAIAPGEIIEKEDLKEIDAIVISDVPAHRIPLQSMVTIMDVVETEGKGLLLINGGHYDTDLETETVIMSYKETPLQRLLPVIGGPRPFEDEPPSRQVAIIIDTSGSMAGWKLQKSKDIAKHIIVNLLRPKDRLDLITFTTGAGHLVIDQTMTPEAKKEALEMLSRVRAGGGTDPSRALAMIGNRAMRDCGIILITDGEFGYVKYRPDCRVTAFEIGSNSFSRSSSLKEFADPIPVFQSFDPNAIKIPYFEPQKREKFFEKESFTPLSMGRHLPKHLRLPVPELRLKGSAVTHLKEGGIMNGVRPKLTDPVLAFAQRGNGFVGVFTSVLEGEWLTNELAKKAIQQWLGRLVPFMERDRYDFKLTDYGDSIDLRISLVAKSGKLPDVTAMNGVLQFPGGDFAGIALRKDDSTPGTFFGEIRVERKSFARNGTLTLRESGPEAVPRVQRIPILIPPKGLILSSPTAEAYSYGQNRRLLRQIAETTGGIFNPPEGTPFFKEKPVTDEGYPLWPILSVIAAFCYLAAITFRRWNP